jgi:UDP-glucose 4-epimerase
MKESVNMALSPRVIVLGAKGFLASRFINRLKEAQISFLAVGSAEVDLTQKESIEALQKIIQTGDSVVMFSALTPDKGKDLRSYYANMKMAEHLVEALEKSSISHLTYISSDAVYSSKGEVISEESSCDPVDLYGLMHLAREKIFSFLMNQIQKPFLILRPCAIYGIGDTHQSYGPNRFFKTALDQGKISLFGQGEEIRDHVSVEDVIEWILEGVTNKMSGVVNLVSGQALSFKEVAEIIAENSSNQVEIQTSSRQNPIVHRRFLSEKREKLFLSHCPETFKTGINRMFKEAMKSR